MLIPHWIVFTVIFMIIAYMAYNWFTDISGDWSKRNINFIYVIVIFTLGMIVYHFTSSYTEKKLDNVYWYKKEDLSPCAPSYVVKSLNPKTKEDIEMLFHPMAIGHKIRVFHDVPNNQLEYVIWKESW